MSFSNGAIDMLRYRTDALLCNNLCINEMETKTSNGYIDEESTRGMAEVHTFIV